MTKGLMPETDAYLTLKEAGVMVPKYFLAKDKEEAVDAAKKTGYPLVLKISSPDISHKSDVGGVVLSVSDEDMLRREYDSLIKRVRERARDARINGVIVAEQIPSGTELFIGGTTDPSFGKVISFGTGGTLVELWKDVAFCLTPADENKVRDMIAGTKVSAILKGFRGSPPLNSDALSDAILKTSRLFEERDDIISFDINPIVLDESRAVCVDARFILEDGKTGKKELEKREPLPENLLRPKSIAVAGASPVPGKIGYYVMQNLLGFKGDVYPVNPGRDEIFGKKVYKKVSDIEIAPDWLIVCVPAEKVKGVLIDAGSAGVKFAVIISAGFKETGDKGRLLEDELLKSVKQYGMRIAGPNCLGIMIPELALNATFSPALPKPGPVGFISQSGAIISAVADRDITGDVGLSAVISVGNQADIRFSDYMHAMAKDERTKAVVLYIEELISGKAFLEDIKKIIKRLPVVAIKSGRSVKGSAAARSHTGSLAGSWDIYKEAFNETGIVIASSVTRAFQTAGLLASEGWPKGKRAVVVTSAGGFAVLSADYAEDNGIELIELDDDIKKELNSVLPFGWSKKNPIDMVGDAGEKRYAETLDILIRHQDKWDIAFVAAAPVTSIDPVRLAKEIVRFSHMTDGIVVGCLIGGEGVKPGIKILNESHIPNFSELSDAFSATGDCIKAAEDAGFIH
ncbi:MAG: acetate--CoA ligase family protein [Methanomicrobiaceae archaeon]|nr:acetate--CoA ligase family protein [Methanomicrobiaceae archaeon]